MSRYETYKPSGIDWIGEVPNNWKYKRVKDFFSILGGNGFPDEEQGNETGDIPFLKVSDINSDDYRVYSSSNYVSNETVLKKGWNVIPANSIVMGKIGEALKKNHRKINTVDCLIDNNMMALQPLPKVNIKFSYYLLSIVDMDWFTNPGTIPAVSTVALKSSKVTLPSPSEQLAIANYLDEQTQKIDRLIANKKAQAEKLKELRQIEINNAVTKGLNPNAEMKDSGIEWLGKIPKHWEVKRLKNLANQISEKSSEILDDDFLVALENIESHTGKFIETASEYENNGIKFKKDNLLYNKLRPYLNKVFLADKDGICVGDIIVIECTPKLYPAFLQFRMLSDSFCSIIMSSVYGAKMPRTSWQFISSLKIAYPSYEEQVQIVEHLNKRTIAIEGLIQNINKQIEKLLELRKIKIYEAVTGKIKVNAYAETTA